ncbi:uncharacterized protein LOC133803443 [Humulus lupulus]|uniref:uncharacterized protein LOC133803443 n=1 Tax=Humulus lupulus TaxID=3486 RepID=UPI002B40AF37|nr:uncharacterized protein LOC133803443 [Humulus lupulus]
MAQQGILDIRAMFQEGQSSSGPTVKKPRFSSKKVPPVAGTTSKSPAKGKDQSSTALAAVAQYKRGLPPPPPRFPFSPARDQASLVDPPAPIIPAPTVRIPVNAKDLEQIPDTFRGTIYETANHTVEHFYKAKPTDLRAIEERSPENVMESVLGMNLIAVLAQHRSIARARAKNEELKAELQTAQAALSASQAALAAAQQGELSAKAALTAAQEGEQAAKAALTAAQEGEQTAKASLAAL